MAEEEYEILPHKLLQDLKYDVEALKKKLSQPDAKASELILEMESLKDSVHELTSVFQKALEQSKQDEEAGLTMKKIHEQLEKVVTQNETIAQGMVAVSDKVEDFINKQGVHPAPKPHVEVKHTMGHPEPHAMPRMAPHPTISPPPMPNRDRPVARPPAMAAPGAPAGFPPPPPGANPKKKGIFG